MKSLMSVFALGLVTLIYGNAISTSRHSCGTDEHTEWVAKSLTEIESVKVGMTRAELMRVFKEEGGISTRTWRRYVYRDCAYIKVDVEFEPVGEPENKVTQSPGDRIIQISRPFLERSIMD